MFTGKKVVYLPTCHSTNDIARQFVHQKEGFEGILIITDAQTAGKGQRGNIWLSEPGKNLTFSIIYKPTFLKAEEAFQLNIIVSLAIWKVLDDHGISTKIKWPNDIYYQNRKLGGILIENILDQKSIAFSIIGIGLNVNQQDLSVTTATSLKRITNQHFELQNVLSGICAALEYYYIRLKSGKIETLKNLYLQNMLGINTALKFRTGNNVVEGIIKGIDSSGRLKVDIAGYTEYFSFKEISFILD